MCSCFLALPVTLKFIYEFALFTGLIGTSLVVLFIVCGVTDWIAPIAFCKSWYGILFSAPDRKYGRVLDLDFKEISIIGTCLFLLTVPCTPSIGML